MQLGHISSTLVSGWPSTSKENCSTTQAEDAGEFQLGILRNFEARYDDYSANDQLVDVFRNFNFAAFEETVPLAGDASEDEMDLIFTRLALQLVGDAVEPNPEWHVIQLLLGPDTPHDQTRFVETLRQVVEAEANSRINHLATACFDAIPVISD